MLCYLSERKNSLIKLVKAGTNTDTNIAKVGLDNSNCPTQLRSPKANAPVEAIARPLRVLIKFSFENLCDLSMITKLNHLDEQVLNNLRLG